MYKRYARDSLAIASYTAIATTQPTIVIIIAILLKSLCYSIIVGRCGSIFLPTFKCFDPKIDIATYSYITTAS